MTAPAWTWLPQDALASPRGLAPLDAALEAWSRRWLPEDRLRRQSPAFGGEGEARPVLAAGPQFTIHAGPGGGDALASRALGLDLARLEMSEDDRKVVDAFAEAMAVDLRDALEAAAGPGDDPGDAASGPVRLVLADDGGRRLLTVVAPRAALARLRRAALPKRARRAGGLTPLRAAVADARVTIHAHLGSAVLPVADARRLAPGDVLILDRRLDDAIDLQAARDGSGFACARLVDAASPRAVQIQPSSPRASS